MNATAPLRVRADLAELEQFKNVSELLDAAVARDASKPLLNFFEDELVLTAGALREKSLRLATLLRDLGVGVGTHVAVMLPNLPIFPVAWMALLRLGAVAVPVNTRFTADEVRFVVGDSNAAFVLVHSDFEEVARNGTTELVVPERVLVWSGSKDEQVAINGKVSELPAVDANARWPAVAPLDPAGIQYTSGTTGFPKGCVLSHLSWTVAAATSRHVKPRTAKRVLSDTPFFYIDAPFELILAMSTGAEQYVSRRPSLSKFTKWLSAFDIDYAEVWEALAEKPADEESEAALRKRKEPLIASTFGMRGASQRPLQERLNAVVREQFGMTEIGLGMYQPYDDEECVGSGSCGIAAPFRETRIVDPDTLEDVPDGTTGELWVRGPGMMLRYHNRLQVNQDVFRPGGWFRTGDLVMRDERGHHFVKGRLKDMIRRSHENIAAGEVEAALEAMEGIDEVAVVGVPDSFRGEEVKVFIVLEEGVSAAELTPQSVRVHALKHLAVFKTPRYYEFIDELPLTPSGKIAKGKLKDSDVDGPYGWDSETNTWKQR